jgi:hypothetical protein
LIGFGDSYRRQSWKRQYSELLFQVDKHDRRKHSGPGPAVASQFPCSDVFFLGNQLIEREQIFMCRNIKTLHNFKPPATDEEIRASALQFVRKLSGFNKPAKANEAAFNSAIDRVAQAAHELLDSLVTNAPPKDRTVEAAKARARTAERFGSVAAEQVR